MNKFKGYGQRVIVIDEKHPLHGRAGLVARCRMCDDGAFVHIEGDPVPPTVRLFPAGDEHGRGNHVLLYPQQCDPVGVCRTCGGSKIVAKFGTPTGKYIGTQRCPTCAGGAS